MRTKRTRLGMLAAIAMLAAPLAAHAQWWANHPHYPRAMADLRQAFWLVHGGPQGDPMANLEEHRAERLIHGAYVTLRNASIADNGDIDAQPAPDPTWTDHRGRLAKALDLLRDARMEIRGETPDPAARGLRHNAKAQIDAAAAAVRSAIAALR